MTTQPQPQSHLASFEDDPGKPSLSNSHEMYKPLENQQGSENSPIDRIPNEIWSSVFYEYTRSVGRPHDLVQVCTRWHDIAVNEPRQWTSISVDIDKITQRGTTEQVLRTLPTQLSRSKGLPLDIHFSDPEILPITPNEDNLLTTSSAILFSTLLEHRHRWRSLNMTLHLSGGAFIIIQESGPFHLPSLENLSARYLTNENQKRKYFALYQILFLHRLINLDDSPSLTTLRLFRLPPTSGVLEKSLATGCFFHLAHMIIDGCGKGSLLDWLKRTKHKLLSCKVEMALNPEIPLPPSTTIMRLDKLESLSIPQAHRPILDFIVPPGLKALVIYPEPDPSEQLFDNSKVLGLIARSGCQLDVLEFYAPLSSDLGDVQKDFPGWILRSEEMKHGTIWLKKVLLSGPIRR